MHKVLQKILFIAGFTICSFGIGKSYDQVYFQHLRNPLFNNTVNHIFQDSKGIIWFSTEAGLVKYNGYEYQHFNLSNASYETNNAVSVFKTIECPLNDFFLWLATDKGLYKFDKSTQQLQHIKFNTGTVNNRLTINDLDVAKDGVLWLSTFRSGLIKYNTKTNQFKKYNVNDFGNGQSKNQYVSGLHIDSKDRLWVHTGGLSIKQFEPISGKFHTYTFDLSQNKGITLNMDLHELSDSAFIIAFSDLPYADLIIFNPNTGQYYLKRVDNASSPYKFNIQNIIEDQNGHIWLGSYTNGIKVTDSNFNTVSHYQNCNKDINCLSSSVISCLFEDHAGSIWIGTENAGVNVWHKKAIHFYGTENPYLNFEGLSNKSVICAFEDNAGNMYFGTDGDGLYMFNKNKESPVHFNNASGLGKDFLESDKILSITEDANGWLYIGQWGGLGRYHPVKQTAELLSKDNKNNDLFNGSFIWKVYCDSKNRIWVATISGGLFLYFPQNGNIIKFQNNEGDQSSISDNYIFDITEDDKGRIWIATAGHGLNLYQEEQQTFKRFKHKPGKKGWLSGNQVNDLFTDEEGMLWVATQNGLDLMVNDSIFYNYNMDDGLPSKYVLGVTQDHTGHYWITTVNGVSRFDKQKAGFTNYTTDDGLLMNRQVFGSPLTHSNGYVIFCNNKGVNIIDPEQFGVDLSKPEPIFSGLKIFDKNVEVGDTINNQVVLSKIMPYTNELTLSYLNNFFSIEFGCLQYLSPSHNQFKYKLEGYDKNWKTLPKGGREAKFYKVNPGEYLLKVKCTDIYGNWNNVPAVLPVTINPPWWSTWWGRIAILAVVITIFVLVNKFRTQNLIQKQKWLEKKLDEKHQEIIRQNNELKRQNTEIKEMADSVHRADQDKLRFFTNISHEFRTPLTLITGPLEMLISQVKDNKQLLTLQLIQRNALRLLRLINQLLEFRKVDTGSFRLNVVKNDIVAFAKGVFISFEPMAEKDNIEYHFKTNKPEITTWFDPDILDKILFNLISNAFKYSGKNGKIGLTISLPENAGHWCIEVIDTGCGIKPAHLPHIFDRFYSVKNQSVERGNTMGIGLALTKELVELHHGTINVQSEWGKGSCFKLIFPHGKSFFKAHEFGDGNDTGDGLKNLPKTETQNFSQNTDVVLANNNNPSSGKELLIVEDNADIRQFLIDILEKQYHIYTSVNGAEGFEKAVQIIPDLVITDVMMPVMDGMAFCDKTKNDGRTSHIPIIMLTAKSSEENVLLGYRSGADGYVKKPFNADILMAQIQTIIENKERIKKRYADCLISDGYFEEQTPSDAELLKRATQIISTNLNNPDFSIDQLAKLLGHSRSVLYKKIDALMGISVNDFIQEVKLKHAAGLLIETDLSISDIAFKSGFKSAPHFSRLFKQKFGVVPTQYGKRK